MTQDLEKQVETFYEVFNSGEVSRFLDECDPDVEFDWSESRSPDSAVYKGRAGIRRFIQQNLEVWSNLRLEPEEIVDLGDDRALVLVRVRMTGRDGIAVEARGAHVATFREGRLLRYKLFQNAADAFDELGVDRPGSD